MNTQKKPVTRRSLRIGTGTRSSRRSGQKTNIVKNRSSSPAPKVVVAQKVAGLKRQGISLS